MIWSYFTKPASTISNPTTRPFGKSYYSTTTMADQESTPLLSSSAEKGYYFLNEKAEETVVSPANGGAFVDELPEGARLEEFEPKVLGAKPKV